MKKVFEDDLISGMQQELRKQASSETPDLVKAAECLHAAMEIFEESGLQVQADEILQLLSKIAARKPGRPDRISDRHTKGLTSEKMIANLKQHGHPLNLADDNAASFEDEYQNWLKKSRKSDNLTPEDVDPDMAGILDVLSYDNDDSDDDLLDMEIKEDSLEVFDKEVPFEGLEDFEDEKASLK